MIHLSGFLLFQYQLLTVAEYGFPPFAFLFPALLFLGQPPFLLLLLLLLDQTLFLLLLLPLRLGLAHAFQFLLFAPQILLFLVNLLLIYHNRLHRPALGLQLFLMNPDAEDYEIKYCAMDDQGKQRRPDPGTNPSQSLFDQVPGVSVTRPTDSTPALCNRTIASTTKP